jgi:hypothetical protein
MATYILPVLFVLALIALSVGIGYICIEFILRLIGRGLVNR